MLGRWVSQVLHLHWFSYVEPVLELTVNLKKKTKKQKHTLKSCCALAVWSYFVAAIFPQPVSHHYIPQDDFRK